MKTALVVMGHKAAEETVFRHMPFWRQAGAQGIIGINPQDGMKWPEEIASTAYGITAHSGPYSAQRIVGMFDMLQHLPFDRFCIIEYDVLILRPIEWPGVGIYSEIIDSSDSRFKCPQFHPPPWIVDRQTAKELSWAGRNHFASDDIEMGFNDRFIALLARTAGINVKPVPGGVFTRHFQLSPSSYPIGRSLAMTKSVTYLHMVKTKHELQYFTGQRDDIPPQQ